MRRSFAYVCWLALTLSAVVARAESPSPPMGPAAQSDAPTTDAPAATEPSVDELRAAFQAEQARRERESEQRAQRLVEQRLREAQTQARREAQQRAHDAGIARRTWGMALVGAALATGTASAYLAAQGSAKNDAIRNGGFAHSWDIEQAAQEGQADNQLAVASAILSAACLAVGVPLLALNLTVPPADPATRANGGPRGMIASFSLPLE